MKIALDYMRASFPENPAFVRRQFKSSAGEADSATNSGYCWKKANHKSRAAKIS